MHRRQVMDYVALSWIWGLSFILLRHVVSAFGWVGAVSFRAFIASALLLLIARFRGIPSAFRNNWFHFAVIGLTTVALQLLGMSYAIPHIGTAMSAIFVATIPLFSAVIASIWGLDRIRGSRLTGLSLGFAGMVMLVGFPSHTISAAFLLGCATSTVGSFAAAFGSNYAHRHLQGVDSINQTMGSFFFGGLLTLPLLLVAPVPSTPALTDYAWLTSLAGFCSALAYALYFRLVAEVGATMAISVEFVVTAIAVAVGAFILHEQLTPLQMIGSTVIIVGCVLVLELIPQRARVTR